MKSVVVCGSSRFAEEIRDFTTNLRKLGVVVYEPHLYRASGGIWENLSEFDKPLVAAGLTYDHFNKIKLADVIYVFNKDGYSGVSTSMEISYGVALGKPIYALSSDDEEICRKILFSGFASCPDDLIRYLQ